MIGGWSRGGSLLLLRCRRGRREDGGREDGGGPHDLGGRVDPIAEEWRRPRLPILSNNVMWGFILSLSLRC